MSAPPGRLAYIAEPLPGNRQEGVSRPLNLTTKRGQVRYLMDELGVSGAQANNLIRAYELDQRDVDASQAAREEFGSWVSRRGDLIVQPRGKRNWRVGELGWRTHS